MRPGMCHSRQVTGPARSWGPLIPLAGSWLGQLPLRRSVGCTNRRGAQAGEPMRGGGGMNKVTLQGNLARELDYREGRRALARGLLAVSRYGRARVDNR
jgi:hypothetical protein